MTVAYHSHSPRDLPGWDGPPALLIGDAGIGIGEAELFLDDAGFRMAPRVPLASGIERLDLQARASLVWVELAGANEEVAVPLLERVRSDANAQRYAAVVSVPGSLLDLAYRYTAESPVELLVDAKDVDRAAVLAIARSRREAPQVVSDVSADNSAVRLRQLSDEVSRIAATLARLSTGVPPPAEEAIHAPAEDAPAISAETVRAVIRARRLRANHLPADLFADPAWDMLLDLLQAEIVQHRVPVSSLCIAAAVPATTALRWIKNMTDSGILKRRDDPHDGRRVFIELSKPTSVALRHYFAEVGKVAVI